MVAHQTNPQTTGARARLILAGTVAAGTLLAAVQLEWPAVLAPAALALACLALLDRRQLAALRNKWLWLGLALAVVLPIWLSGTPGDRARAVGRGPDALVAGATMAVRVITTLTALLLVGGQLAPLAISRVFGRLAGQKLGLACAIGVNLLPSVLEILRRTTLALRLRGGFRRHRLANLKRLATAVGVQTVRLSEDVAEALLLAQPPDSNGQPEEPPA